MVNIISMPYILEPMVTAAMPPTSAPKMKSAKRVKVSAEKGAPPAGSNEVGSSSRSVKGKGKAVEAAQPAPAPAPAPASNATPGERIKKHRTHDAAPPSAGPWSRLKLAKPLSAWLQAYIAEDLGFAHMTPVQASAIPLFLSHRDVIVEAITGSGKTLAYLLPIVEMLSRRCSADHELKYGSTSAGDGAAHIFQDPAERREHRQLGAVIIVPTRELAAQIFAVLERMLRVQPSRMEEEEWEMDREARISAKIAASSSSVKEQLSRGEALRLVRKEEQEAAGGGGEDGEQVGLRGPAPLTAQLVVGGSTIKPQRDYQLFRQERPDILVGTPGRLEELLKRDGVETKAMEMLVMDEADRLLDLGFLPQLTAILALLPRQRRTGLFSATMTDAMGELARLGLRNPSRIVVKVEKKVQAPDGSGTTSRELITEDRRTPVTLQNYALVSRPENKLAQLVRLLRYESQPFGETEAAPQPSGAAKMIVYFATCAQVNYFYKVLSSESSEGSKSSSAESSPLLPGVQLHSLHGKQTPSRRKATYSAFVQSVSAPASGLSSVLFCTDVAARGLDLPDVDCVVQFDPPTDPSSFSHRVGRTARAGRKGRAVVLLHEGREEEYIDFMKLRKVPMQRYAYLTEAHAGSIRPGAEPEGADEGAGRIQTAIRTLVKRDRQLHDLGALAFVSFVRAYSKHEAAYIFRLPDLDLEASASAFALLRLPKMPERGKQLSEGGESRFAEEPMDMDAYAYLDPAKERRRQEQLAQRREAQALAAANGEAAEAAKKKKKKATDAIAKGSKVELGQAWSQQKRKKEVKELRKEKKERKRKWKHAQEGESSGDESSDGAGLDKWKKEALRNKKGDKAAAAAKEKTKESGDESSDWDAEEKEEKRRRKAAKTAQNKDMELDDVPDAAAGETFFGDL